MTCSQLSPPEEAVIACVDDEAIVRDLAELVAIPSVDGSPAEAEAQRWCAARLRDLGLHVDLWDIELVAEQLRPDFPGMEVPRTEGLGCAASSATSVRRLRSRSAGTPTWCRRATSKPGRDETRSSFGSTIIPANAGSLTFRVDVPGRATHGSTRTRGVSAVETSSTCTTRYEHSR